MDTPSYIKTLLKSNGKAPSGRKVWSIDLEMVWLPFFTATNVMGDTFLPAEALGAPLRLAYEPDGAVKFTKTGRPVIRVVKEIQDSVRMVRENFVAGLMAYANGVALENPEGYQAQVKASMEAGYPIRGKDTDALAAALDKRQASEAAQAIAQAEVLAAVQSPPKPKAKARAKAAPQPEAEPAPVKELALAIA
ncbi:MAG: hypothetical protein HY687_00745 [Chloroflexi bacterium]|nr:hypothetical protein [Chloroflexota bacterium]